MVPLRFLTAATLAAVLLCSAAGAQQPLPKAGEAIAYRPGRVIALRTNPTTLPRVGGVLSRDGRYYFGRAGKDTAPGLIVYDLQLDKAVRQFAGIGGGRTFALSRDETVVADVVGTGKSANTITLYNVATAKPLLTITIPAGRFDGRTARTAGLAFSPDRATLYAATSDGQVGAWGVATGAVLWRVETQTDADAAHARFVVPTHDGKLLVAAGNSGYLRVLNAATGAEVRKLDVPVIVQGGVPGPSLWRPQVSADGRRAVACDTNDGIWSADLVTGDVRHVHKLGANVRVGHVVLSPSGRLVLFNETGEKHRGLLVAPLDGKPAPALPSLSGVPEIVAASASGDRVLLWDSRGLTQYCLPKE
jgi:WD40 repeat protein